MDVERTPRMLETWKQLERWTKPLLTVFGDRDPISKGADQEDQPEAIAEHIHAFAR